MSGGREIVTLRGALYGAGSVHYFGEIGKRGDRVPSIHPFVRLQSLRLPHSGSQGDAGGFFPPSCLGLKAGLHPRQLASGVDTKEANGCPRSHHADSVSVPVSENVLVFGLREDAGVPGEKLTQEHAESCKLATRKRAMFAARRRCCPQLHGVTQKRHAWENNKNIKHETLSLCCCHCR